MPQKAPPHVSLHKNDPNEFHAVRQTFVWEKTALVLDQYLVSPDTQVKVSVLVLEDKSWIGAFLHFTYIQNYAYMFFYHKKPDMSMINT